MANLVTFPFQNKEGKYFAPISCSEPDYIVVNGTIQANGDKITSGLKGAYATIKLTLPIATFETNASTKKELFALNTLAVNSSS